MTKETFDRIKAENNNYLDMLERCMSDGMILANGVQAALESKDLWFDPYYNGDKYYDDETEEFTDIYQQYIISGRDAERIGKYTNEIIFHNEETDIWLLCVTHFGTSWCNAPANWKDEVSDD